MTNTLIRIPPRQCEIGLDCQRPQCTEIAEWQYDGVAVCLEDMQDMARMNSDNEEAFTPALQQSKETVA